MLIAQHPAWQEFTRLFNRTAQHRHRYELFRDFVTVMAITLRNTLRKDDALEQEYLHIVGRYGTEDVQALCELFAHTIMLLQDEPIDVLGQLYMALNLGSEHNGQFFTPPEIAEMMARMMFDEHFLKKQPFITLNEPACGSGSMVLAWVKVMIDHGFNPAQHLWVECQDIDRLSALMCYIQLTLWNVPGVILVGNSLTREIREQWLTLQHHLGFWEIKLRRR